MWRTNMLSLRNTSGHFMRHGEPILSCCQPPYGLSWHPYNERLYMFKGRVLHRLGHGKKGIIVEVVAKGPMPSYKEEIVQLPITSIPKLLTLIPGVAPL